MAGAGLKLRRDPPERHKRLLGSAPERLAAPSPDTLAGDVATRLFQRVEGTLVLLQSLSPLTEPLALGYVERVGAPMAAMPLAAGARVVVEGYLAHRELERSPADFGITDIPVHGGFPPLNRHGRPPQDLLTRVVKVTRRHFTEVCALTPEEWEALVATVTAAVHDRAGEATEGKGLLAPVLVEGLLRTGWVLRQVDLAYGFEPEVS